jgi:hypothetical protein
MLRDEEDDWLEGNPDDEDDVYPDDEDEEPTIPCPHCGAEIHEDSERCPSCEAYISKQDAPPSPKPWWFIVGVIACLYVVYRWIIPG